MSEIYLRDGMTPRRTLDIINPIIISLLPNGVNYTNSKLTPSGFIYRFPHETDPNSLFSRENYDKLTSESLSIDFAKNNQATRSFVVQDMSEDSYHQDAQTLIDDINARNHINVIKIDKFPTTLVRRYFKIFVDTKDTCFRILTAAKIKIFNENLIVKPLGHSMPNDFIVRTRDLNPGPHLANRGRFASTPGHLNSTNHHQNLYGPPMPNYWHRNAENNNSNVRQLELILKSTNDICRILSNGLQNPQLFVNMCIANHKLYGLPTLKIPNANIVDSLNLYKANNPATATPPA